MSELKNSIARARSEIDCIVLRLKPHFPTLGVRQLVERLGELDAVVHDKAQKAAELARHSALGRRFEEKTAPTIADSRPSKPQPLMCSRCTGGIIAVAGCDRCGDLGFLVGDFERTVSFVCKARGCRECGYSGVHRVKEKIMRMQCPRCEGSGNARIACPSCGGSGYT